MIDEIIADNGVKIPIGGLQQTFVYVGDFVSTATIVFEGVTYVQTFTNNGTNITVISAWVAQ